jgi:hypothetical protein
MIPSMAHAIGFGEMLSQSAIGEPFRAEFRLFGVTRNEGSECLRVVAAAGDDGIPQLRNAQVQIQGPTGAPVAIVTRSKPVSDPIIRVTLEETCSARLQRTYTLLLPMPASTVKAPVTTAQDVATPQRNSAPPPLGTDTLGQAYTLPQASSIGQLARQLFPRSSADRSAFIAALRSANTGDRSLRSTRRPLAAGTTLMLPTPAEIDQARAALQARAQLSKPAPRPAPLTPARPADAERRPPDNAAADSAQALASAPAAAPADRLVLDGDSPESSGFRLSSRLGNPDLVNSTTEAEREILRREQKLIMAIDEQIMTRKTLSDRIARLEALQDALRAEMAATDGENKTAPEEANPASGPVAAAPDIAPPAPNATASAPAPDTTARPSVAADEPTAVEISFTWWPVAAAGGALVLLGLLWWRRSRPEPDDDTLIDDAPGEVVVPAPPTEVPPKAAPADLPGEGDSFDFSVIEWDGPPPAELDHSIAPIALGEEEMAEEHESAVELADIMMSFGRVQGAAETLAEFIRGNPKKAVQPWIKLLEVYKAADMRAEFDALTHKLNQTFNVKTVTWESFDEVKKAPDSVEQMPHIINSLKDQWMTVDCQRYLQMLLRDNRGGTREGFPLGVVDDLLLLQAVLEDALGPYRPSDEEIAAALRGSGNAATRKDNPNGFVAPPTELAPELSFEEKSGRSPTAEIDERDIFDLDGPHERAELPDLDFQLDSEFMTAKDAEDEPAPDADEDEDEDADSALRATWVMPKQKDED